MGPLGHRSFVSCLDLASVIGIIAPIVSPVFHLHVIDYSTRHFIQEKEQEESIRHVHGILLQVLLKSPVESKLAEASVVCYPSYHC